MASVRRVQTGDPSFIDRLASSNELILLNNRELTDFRFGQLKHSRLFEEMAIKMANFLRPKCASLGHFLEKIFQHFSEMRRIIDTRFENVCDDVLRQQSCVVGEKAEDDTVEEPRDAQVFALRDRKLSARASVDQLDGLALLQ